MDFTIARSPGQCCIKTVEHTGTARGTIEKVADVNTYIAHPANLDESRRIILFFADVYGPFFLNSQLIMDYWASQGYLVLALDYFEGDPVQNHLDEVGPNYSIEFDFVPGKMVRAKQLAPAWLDAVREKFGTSKTQWMAVGYCFGAPFVMDCLAMDWITAGACAHPAVLKDHHFQDMKKPLLLSCAEVDHTFPLEFRRRAEDIMIDKKATYHIQVFCGVTHGFALRGNVNDPVAKWAKEQSAKTIGSWFDMFCSTAELQSKL
ncbi:alpha/beta-hydrolase [Laetiporus sulphureus 93-53]|uniref:Alpha/beta-hydrolase n=1 Tax=Laetiporus sulphureus 93-53 TaxID=1314785 RepID=A0A165C2A6_9APHY|nr:alpha/beta-hydrolase [Laetiporus sulphureus 93-53]KZT02071.1 alpha/beta-hydrolase [Laetiporus sulphureus 93-53]